MSRLGRFWPTIGSALWLSVLWWPFSLLTNLPRQNVAAVFPLAYALADLIPRWNWRVAGRLSTIGAAAALELPQSFWLYIRTPHPGAYRGQIWTALGGDHRLLGLELVLVFGIAGWALFRRGQSATGALGLLFGGVSALAASHTFWGVPVTTPLAVFLLIGLGMLHHYHMTGSSVFMPEPPRFPWRLTVGGLLVLPLVVGGLTPSVPGHWSRAQWAELKSRVTGAPLTGLGIGVPNINHPVSPNPTPVLTIIGAPKPTLWKVAQYSTFNGVTWSNATQPPIALGSQNSLFSLFPPDSEAPVVRWTVTVHTLVPQAHVVYTGFPVRISTAQTVQGQWWPDSQSLMLSPNPSTYHLTLRVPEFNPVRLAQVPTQAAPTGLQPDLQVPSNLSPRVAALARQITAKAVGPWNKVEAIRQYLDRREQYTLNFQPSPTGNAVNQFLLVTHAGYCDQFSTSLIMMARELGIPARWIIGYNAGSYDPTTHTDIIDATDAHSWAEVWIGSYGWVPVDPTPAANQAASFGTTKVESAVSSPTPSPPPAALPPGGGGSHPPAQLATLLPGAEGLAGALLLAAVAWRIRRHRQQLPRRIARIAGGFRRLAGNPRDAHHHTWRDLWRKMPDSAQSQAVPILRLLEEWAYAPTAPAPSRIADVESRLRQLLAEQNPLRAFWARRKR